MECEKCGKSLEPIIKIVGQPPIWWDEVIVGYEECKCEEEEE